MQNYSLFDEVPPQGPNRLYLLECGIEFREIEGVIRVGELQNAIRNEDIREIRVDLTLVEWVDPMPLLLLGCVLAEFSQKIRAQSKFPRGASVIIDLGGHDVGRQEHRLCLKFLTNHGFIGLFAEIGTVKWRHVVSTIDSTTGEEKLEEEVCSDKTTLLDVLARYPHKTEYTNTVLVAAQLIPLNRATEENDALHKEMESIFVQMRTHARIAKFLDDPATRDVLFQKLRTLLYELVLNVGEHAYSARPFACGAIYAKIHGRRPDGRSDEDIKKWNDLLRYEKSELPGMSQFDPNPRMDWVDVFVCDVGDGLTAKIAEWKSSSGNKAVDRAIEKAKQSKNPLESLSKRLFVSGFSSVPRNSPTRTPITGLQHLGHVLSIDEDYARIYSENGTWLGGKHPWRKKKKGDVTVLSVRDQFAARTFCSGTAYAIHIQPKIGVILEKSKWQEVTDAVRNAMLNRLRGDDDLNPTTAVYLCDRVNDSNCRPPDKNEVSKSIAFHNANHINVILRPPPLVGKHNIGEWLDWISKLVVPTGTLRSCCLYISELTPAQGVLFLEFIERNATLGRNGIAIYLITDDWSVACLAPAKHGERGFQFKTDLEQAGRFHSLNQNHDALTSIELIAHLRRLDSEIFWGARADDRDKITDLVRSGETIWNETRNSISVLSHYLDFGQALVNEHRYTACLRALRRVLALRADCRPIASDQLVDSLVKDAIARTYTPVSQHDGRGVLVVGSVCVTARTTARYLERQDIDVQEQIFLLINSDIEYRTKHNEPNAPQGPLPGIEDSALNETASINSGPRELETPNLPSRRIAALSWMPPDSLPRSQECWRRVANTPFIAPKGSLSLSLVRFRNSAQAGLEESHYPRSPQQMYRDFDRYAMLKLGHWNYQGGHDLITINLAQAFRYAHIDHGMMFLWLRDQFKSLFSSPNKNTEPLAHILVYPSHPVSDEIIALLSNHNEFKGCLPKNGIFPVKYLGNHTVSPAIASPMLEHLVAKATATYKRGAWTGVIFDDAAVSGKHQRELSQLLQDLGSAPVRTIAFIDRTRNVSMTLRHRGAFN